MRKIMMIAIVMAVLLLPGCFDPDFSNEQNDYHGLSPKQVEKVIEMYNQELDK